MTRLPLDALLAGLRGMLLRIYDPDAFCRRAIRALEYWNPRSHQHAPPVPFWYQVNVVLVSMWRQGILGSYRKQYWKFLGQLIGRWGTDRRKLYLGFVTLLSAQHFLRYAEEVANEIEVEMRAAETR